MRKLVAILWIMVLLFPGCKEKESDFVPETKGVYIISEGNFNFGNGEVSLYNRETKETTNNLFQKANGYSLGDVVQSMYVKDTLGFIVVNNSQKIVVVGVPSFKVIRSIYIPSSSPRYFLPVSDSIGYVSELYANKIHIINYSEGHVSGYIAVPQYTEHLQMIGNYVFAEGKKIYANTSAKGAVFRIDTRSHRLINKVEFEGDVSGIVTDNVNHLWVLVDSNTATNSPAFLKEFDDNLAELSSYSLHMNHFVHNLSIDRNSSSLYFVSDDIYVCRSFTVSIHPEIFFSVGSYNFYSLDVDPYTGDVYAADALDYVQSSLVLRINKTGQLIHSFSGGVISGNYAFTE